MKKLLLFIAIFVMSLSFTQNIIAQVSHLVNTQGMTFFPQSITITAGDTVTFINTGGFHNVNGSLASFPGNPQGFANSAGVVGPGVMLSNFVFGIPGTYNYQCDPHIPGMVGTIIVQPSSSPTITSVITIDPLCSGQFSGSATVSISQSNPPIDLNVQLLRQNSFGNWFQIASSYSPVPAFLFSHNFVALGDGDYRVDLKDAVTGVLIEDDFFTLVNPPPFLIDTLITTTESANGACDGSAYVSGSGGSAPYDYSWSNGAVTNSTINLCAGIYCVTLNDANGCIVTTCDTIGLSQQTYGCTDSLACNYNPLAVIDDSSCVYGSTYTTHIQAACDSYTWINGVTYTSSNNTATWTSVNAFGCINIATLDLTINNSTTSTDVQFDCDSYTWINGVTYTSSNNTATFQSTNAAGCTNTATLYLIINYSTPTIDVQTHCDSYTWNGSVYTASGTYTFIATNSAGCDSTETLDLTINNSTTSTYAQVTCDSYTWDTITYTSSGLYTHLFSSQGGCDSIVILDLTIYNSTYSYDTLAVGASVVWNGITLNVSGDYSVTLNNLAGCDSIVYLNLTITNTTGISDIANNKSNLVKITDMLGQETPYKRNTPLFYIYDDGTVEKRIVIE